MGNSCIIIRSVGPHDNDLSCDAERIAERTVAELRATGHAVLTASVEVGGGSIVLVGSKERDLAPVRDPYEPARAAYERYLAASGGKSLVSGAELPAFEQLGQAIKDAWRAAADPAAPRWREFPDGTRCAVAAFTGQPTR